MPDGVGKGAVRRLGIQYS